MESWMIGCLSLGVCLVIGLVIYAVLSVMAKHTERDHLHAVHILCKAFRKPILAFFVGLGSYLLICLCADYSLSGSSVPALLVGFRIICVFLLTKALWDSSGIISLAFTTAKRAKKENLTTKTVARFLERIYQFILALFCFVLILNELDFNVNGLLTGAGLVGVIFTLAAQNSVSSIIAGIIILFDRPFNIGEYIIVGDVEGTVEDITFQSTKIRGLDNSLFTMPNSMVASHVVNNATNRQKRMYDFSLAVTYQTSHEQLEQLMEMIRKALPTIPKVEVDTVRVNVKEFQDSAIGIMVRCYIMERDYLPYMNVRNEVNLKIIDIMRECGTEFAYPSVTIYPNEEKNK